MSCRRGGHCHLAGGGEITGSSGPGRCRLSCAAHLLAEEKYSLLFTGSGFMVLEPGRQPAGHTGTDSTGGIRSLMISGRAATWLDDQSRAATPERTFLSAHRS